MISGSSSILISRSPGPVQVGMATRAVLVDPPRQVAHLGDPAGALAAAEAEFEPGQRGRLPVVVARQRVDGAADSDDRASREFLGVFQGSAGRVAVKRETITPKLSPRLSVCLRWQCSLMGSLSAIAGDGSKPCFE